MDSAAANSNHGLAAQGHDADVQAHVFVTFGAMSVIAAAELCWKLLAEDAQASLWLFSTVPLGAAEFPSGVRIQVLDESLAGMSEWKKPQVLADFTQRMQRSLAQLGEARFALYAPHVFELPANYFAYYDSRVSSLQMLPDGLANYVPRPLLPGGLKKAAGFAARVGLRKLAARKLGTNYKVLLSGDVTQYQSVDWVRTWTFQAQGLKTKSGDVSELVFEHLRGAPPVEAGQEQSLQGVLVVDQEIHELVDSSLEHRLRDSLRAYVRALNEKVLYKAHPRGRDRLAAFREAEAASVEAVPQQLLAEHAARLHGVSRVVGFYSTPLLMLQVQGLQRIAFLPSAGAKGVLRPAFVAELREALRASGAKVFEVD